jgi:tRNA A58 N-methylase Trm61
MLQTERKMLNGQIGGLAVSQLIYNATAAAGYERAFARISSHFIPFLLKAGRVSSGGRVLDVATGTGLAAEAALAIVGTTGHVTATDISPHTPLASIQARTPCI